MNAQYETANNLAHCKVHTVPQGFCPTGRVHKTVEIEVSNTSAKDID